MAGDFTGDGQPRPGRRQLQIDNDVSVLLGNGDGTFQPPVTYAVGSDPAAIVAGDFTGDGHLDLAVANDGSDDTVVGAAGQRRRHVPARRSPTRSGSDPDAIVAGDFTGNGHLDLAVANVLAPTTCRCCWATATARSSPRSPTRWGRTQTPSWRATSPATAASTWPSPTQRIQRRLGAAGQRRRHVPAPGHLRGGVGPRRHRGGRLHRRRPDSTWPSPTTTATRCRCCWATATARSSPRSPTRSGSDPDAIVAGDFTGDGRLDLAVANTDGDTVSVLLGNGDGTFQPQVTYAVGSGPDAIVAGDFTGDGRLDLAVANCGSNDVSVLLGNGDGTFQPQVDRTRWGRTQPPSWRATSPATASLDLAVANYGSNDVSVLLGNGDGTFQPQVDLRGGVGPRCHRGGRLQRRRPARPGRRQRRRQHGVGAAGQRRRHVPAPGHLRGGVVPVRHRGGRLHRRRPTSTWPSPTTTRRHRYVSVLLGNGDGTFQPPVTYAVGSDPRRHRGGRLHRQRPPRPGRRQLGTDDTVVGAAGQRRRHLPAPGHLRGGVVPSTPSWRATSPATADLDLAVANATTPTTVSVLLGNGDGTFQPQVTYAVGSDPAAIVAGDFTGDGQPRPGRRQRLRTTTVSVLLGNGDGTFQPAGHLRGGVGTHAPSWRATSTATASSTWPSPTQVDNDVSVLAGQRRRHVRGPRPVRHHPSCHAPGGRRHRRRHRRCPGRRRGRGHPLSPGHPRPARHLRAARHGQPRLSPRATSPGCPTPIDGPVLASVDAHDNAISFYAYRNGGFVRVGSLTTGQLPAQIIAADLNGDGLNDLVVRNAGDGTLSVFFGTQTSSSVPSIPSFDPPTFLPPVTLPVGLGVSDVQAVDTTGSGRLDLVVTNKLTGQVSVLLQPGRWHLRRRPSPIAPGPGCPRSIPAARPRSPAWRRRRASPPDRSRPAVRPTW